MPLRHKTFARDEIFPSWWPNAVAAFIGASVLEFRITKLNATTIQVVAGANDDLVAIAVHGLWRYIEASITRAHPGGGAGTYDIFVTAANNVIVNSPNPNTDNTNYAFALDIKTSGATPTIVGGTVDVYRKVGSLQWDGAAITSIAQTAGVGPVAAHAATHRPGGTDETAHTVLSGQQVYEPGVPGQVRAGRQLVATDFTTQLGLAAPVAVWNLSDLTDASGNARTLTNKGTVPFGVGINGLASTAAVFAGSTGQSLWRADSGGGDPFRIPVGSISAWVRTAKRSTFQYVLSRQDSSVAANRSYYLSIDSTNVALAVAHVGGAANTGPQCIGTSDIADDRWHMITFVYDGVAGYLYVDGELESFATGAADGPMNMAASPVTISGQAADQTLTAALASPMYGRIDEAFVTPDILDAEQVRFLYCAKIAHGFPAAPTNVRLSVRRQRRGGTLLAGDFPTQPVRLHNFTAGALTDAGSGGVALTNNNTAVAVAGADGVQGNAFNLRSGASQSLSSTDAGLPAGTATRSYGAWFKTINLSATIVGWGTTSTADARVGIFSGGSLGMINGADQPFAPVVTDGEWHFVVIVEDNSAGDGVKRKMYLDGRLVLTSTTLNTITLAGANRFRVGAFPDASGNFFDGDVDGVFVCNYALTADEAAKLFAKGSLALGASPKDPGAHIEAVDATNIYAVLDIDPQHLVDLVVA